MAERLVMDIEAMVSWALREQGLGWEPVGTAGGAGWVELGTRVDISPRGSVASPSTALMTDTDALVIKAAIDQFANRGAEVAGERLARRGAATLLIQYGRAGLRPDWGEEGYGAPAPLTDKRGRPRFAYEVPGNKRSAKTPLLDWLGYDAHCELIDYHRSAWTLWRDGLVELVGCVNPELERHRATGPAAPAAPWAGQAGRIGGGGALARRRLAASAEFRERAADWGFPDRPDLSAEAGA